MNNGRPNYGNTPGWGNNQQGRQQMGYPQQNGYAPYQQGQQPQGYPQTGYPPQQTGFQPRTQGFQQPYQQQPYGQQPYAQQQPYQQPQGYGRQQQPQRGYPQQGYGQQMPVTQRPTGYQPMTQPVQSPYQQGYQYPQGGQPQGWGYAQPVPKPQQKKNAIKPETLVMIALCGVLPVLFILGLVFPGMPALKWVFVGLAVVSVAFLWLKPVVASNVRLTFTGVYCALAIVALVSALTGAAPMDKASGGNNQMASQGSGQQSASMSSNGGGESQADTLGNWTTEAPAPVTTPVPGDGLSSEAVEQLKSFFYFWSVNNQDNMLTLCAPSWRSSAEEPAKALFSILQNRIPLEYDVEKISGTENDTARTVSVTAEIDKRNGREPQKYRFQVIMKKEDGVWYVDPESLESNVVETTAVVTVNITPEPPPAAMQATDDTVLYWNPDGGSYYHADPNCPSTDPKYLPFKGEFVYRDINAGDYADLKPCGECGAPLRAK